MDEVTGLLTSRCVNCGRKLWRRDGQWGDSPDKGLRGNPPVIAMVCPAKKPAPLQHVPEYEAGEEE